MAYKRKTRDYCELQGNYGQGWECLCAGTWQEMRANRQDYRENEGGNYRIVWKRERITND